MGCHSSKQARRDLLLSPSLLPRSKSLPDSHNDHVVSLTSSTLGSLGISTSLPEEGKKQLHSDHDGDDRSCSVISIELAKARAWSDMIDQRIPRTPTETPPNEPESIDAMELMAGFHGDYSPLDRRSFSFYPIGHFDSRILVESNLGNMGPVNEPDSIPEEEEEEEVAKKKQKKNAVVFYFTSLRGIRKTYDDCCEVKAILTEYRVRIDERDVSMHGGFKEELREKTGDAIFLLPRVFVDERDLGGVEEVKRMHDTGDLAKILEGHREKGEAGEEAGCEACGDVRFVLCSHCSGSCRVYVEEEEEWRRCSECNENGIVRCPVCC